MCHLHVVASGKQRVQHEPSNMGTGEKKPQVLWSGRTIMFLTTEHLACPKLSFTIFNYYKSHLGVEEVRHFQSKHILLLFF